MTPVRPVDTRAAHPIIAPAGAPVMSRTCDAERCDRIASMAVRVTRPSRPDLRITVYADVTVAPPRATPYCKEHGIGTATDLMRMVVR